MTNLKDRLIRLGSQSPDLRRHLKPVLDYITAGVQSGVFYHGTSLENGKSIMREGIKPGGGIGWGNPSRYQDGHDEVFLTGDFAKSARYAKKFDEPVVLEVRISTPDRVKDLRTDPLDDPRRQGGPGHMRYTREDDPLSGLRRKLQRFADKRGWWLQNIEDPTKDSTILPSFTGDDEAYENQIQHTNLYKSVKRFLHKDLYPSSKNKADNEYQQFLRIFRPDQYGDLHIRNNGTLRLDDVYWETRHQLTYPNELPPAAIKALWAPEPILEELGLSGGEERSFSTSLLPGEAEDIWEEIRSTATMIPELLRDEGELAALEVIQETYDILERDGEGALREAREVLGDYADQIRGWDGPLDQLADDIERDADYLPPSVDNEMGFAQTEKIFKRAEL